jgi:hypothetical protein
MKNNIIKTLSIVSLCVAYSFFTKEIYSMGDLPKESFYRKRADSLWEEQNTKAMLDNYRRFFGETVKSFSNNDLLRELNNSMDSFILAFDSADICHHAGKIFSIFQNTPALEFPFSRDVRWDDITASFNQLSPSSEESTLWKHVHFLLNKMVSRPVFFETRKQLFDAKIMVIRLINFLLLKELNSMRESVPMQEESFFNIYLLSFFAGSTVSAAGIFFTPKIFHFFRKQK